MLVVLYGLVVEHPSRVGEDEFMGGSLEVEVGITLLYDCVPTASINHCKVSYKYSQVVFNGFGSDSLIFIFP